MARSSEPPRQQGEQSQLATVLIVEDDPRSASLMEAVLEEMCSSILVADSAARALDLIAEHPLSLITLDVGLPDLSGLVLLYHVRQMTDTPVIMVTAQDQPATIVEALDSGADDYVMKPFRPAEFRARVMALMRRARGTAVQPKHYSDQNLVIDFARSEVVTRKGVLSLTGTERRLLAELVGNAGKILDYATLLRRVWGEGYEGQTENLHVYISYLRKKLDQSVTSHGYIRTHRGLGYEFVQADEAKDQEPARKPVETFH